MGSFTSSLVSVDDSPPCEAMALAAAAGMSASNAITSILHRADTATRASEREITELTTEWARGLILSRPAFVREARRVAAFRSGWMDKQWEEIDSMERLLCAGGRLCDTAAIPEADFTRTVFDSMSLILPLIECGTAFPRLCAYIDVPGDGVDGVAFETMYATHIQEYIDTEECTVGGPVEDMYRCGVEPVRSLTVRCVDSEGEPVRSLTSEDVHAAILDGTTSVGDVTEVSVVDGTVRLRYTVEEDIVRDSLDVSISVYGRPCFIHTVKVRRPISGKLLRSFDGVGEADGNCGVAISPDGNVFAVSNYENQYIYIHSAADGSFIRSFGGHGAEPGEFDEVAKLCFAPNGHLLVAEDENARVQELTVSGEVVRIIGVGHIHGSVFGLAADDRYIIVGKDDEGPQLYLFSSSDGAFIRSIGEQGMLPGLLSDCSGIRFIAGGSQVIIAENESKRLSVYNITGEFVRTLCCDSLSSPDDVEIAWNGDIIVADCDVHRLCVFSPDGSTLLHMVGQDIAPLNLPTALALHPLTGALFVLNNEGRRVLVFE